MKDAPGKESERAVISVVSFMENEWENGEGRMTFIESFSGFVEASSPLYLQSVVCYTELLSNFQFPIAFIIRVNSDLVLRRK